LHCIRDGVLYPNTATIFFTRHQVGDGSAVFVAKAKCGATSLC
jgi:hypothetical protein